MCIFFVELLSSLHRTQFARLLPAAVNCNVIDGSM